MTEQADSVLSQFDRKDPPLTAAEVRAFASSNGVLGYDRRETRKFLQRVAVALEAAAERVSTVDEQRDAIAEALLYAAEAAKVIRKDATDRSEAIVRDAADRAEGILKDATDRGESILKNASERRETIIEEGRVGAARILSDAEEQRETAETAAADAQAVAETVVHDLAMCLADAKNRLTHAFPPAVGNAPPTDTEAVTLLDDLMTLARDGPEIRGDSATVGGPEGFRADS